MKIVIQEKRITEVKAEYDSMVTSLRSEMTELKKEVTSLKDSLVFTQNELGAIKKAYSQNCSKRCRDFEEVQQNRDNCEQVEHPDGLHEEQTLPKQPQD